MYRSLLTNFEPLQSFSRNIFTVKASRGGIEYKSRPSSEYNTNASSGGSFARECWASISVAASSKGARDVLVSVSDFPLHEQASLKAFTCEVVLRRDQTSCCICRRK